MYALFISAFSKVPPELSIASLKEIDLLYGIIDSCWTLPLTVIVLSVAGILMISPPTSSKSNSGSKI